MTIKQSPSLNVFSWIMKAGTLQKNESTAVELNYGLFHSGKTLKKMKIRHRTGP